jgi:hypothetical protein
MIEAIYQMYKEQKRMLTDEPQADSEELKSIIADAKLSMTILDEKNPEYRERYEREQAIYRSFTPEQQDFICWQIGEWYLMMKTLLEGTHNLGYMKEKLKTMICGDE